MILKIRNEQGKFIDIPSIVGPAGADGKTPVRGIDYFTEDDIEYIINQVGTKINLDEYLTITAANEEFAKKIDTYTKEQINKLIEDIEAGTVDLKDYLKKEDAEKQYVTKENLTLEIIE